MKNMKWALIALTALGMVATVPTKASAAPIVFEFCGFTGASTSCEGLSSATLSFELDGSTLGDLNDYIVSVSFTGSPTGAHPYLDFFSFSVNGVQTPGGYEGLPVFTSPPGTDYAFVFDQIGNGGTPCTTNTNQAQEVCANSPGLGEALGDNGSVSFTFTVNFADDNAVVITSTSGVNLRALFTTADGTFDGPILSPSGNYEGSEGEGTNEAEGQGPEPASLLLFGLALSAAGVRMRKARA